MNEQENATTGATTQLEHCQNDLAQANDKIARLSADLDNMQRRTAKERLEWVARAQATVIKDVLPIIDDVERGIAMIGAAQDANAQAFHMVHKALIKFLEHYNVTEISAQGEPDPALHEAIMQVPATEQISAGSVVAVLQKGYTLNGVVIRPAKVSVAH